MKGSRDLDDSSDIDVSTTGLEPLEEESPESQDASSSSRSWLHFAQSAFLLLACLISLSVAAAGFFTLVYIFFSRSFAPPAAHLAKDLYFDYTDSRATATATFLDSSLRKGMASGGGKGAAPRVFAPGQQMNIWLELEAAEAHGNVNTDVFQVVGQLLTVDGALAATASRPCLLTYWSPTLRYFRSLVTAPLVLAGLWREHQLLKVPLFRRYADQPDKPFAEFRAILRAASKDTHLPHLYSARVHVDMVLGFIGRLVYMLRPGTWTMLLLMAAALSMISGGLVAAAVFLLLWLYTGPKVHAPPHSPPQSDVDAESDFGVETETGAAVEVAEVSSEPVPRSGSSLKEALETARSFESKPSTETVLRDQKLAAPGLVFRGSQRQLGEAG